LSNVRPSKKTRSRGLRGRFVQLTSIATAGLGLASFPLLAQEGTVEAGQEKLTGLACTGCHGMDGNAPASQWPSLAGQHATYTRRQLEAYQEGERADQLMEMPVEGLSGQDIRDIAAYYAAQSMNVKGADPALVERGERIYRGGIPERDIAACIACHGPAGKGNPLAGYPRVSHQHAAYLEKTLRDYRSGARRSDAELNQMMRNVAEMLLDDEIRALASYMQGLN